MDKLKQATEYAKSGNKIKARQLLAELLQSEPNNELVWLWMSGVVDNTSQQRYCLEQVLKIDPNNQHAVTGISRLRDLENESRNANKQDIVPESAKEPAAKSVSEIDSKYMSQPVPDISTWPNRFTGWGIWPEVADTGSNDTSNLPRETSMGLLVAEAHVAAKRILGWALFLFVIAIGLAALAILVFDRSSQLVSGVIALLFFCGVLY